MTRQPTIRSLFADDSTASRCLGIIERHGARMMRTGGGPLPREDVPAPGYRDPVTESLRAQIEKLGESGECSVKDISRIVGRGTSTVASVLNRAGVKARDGRKAKKEGA